MKIVNISGCTCDSLTIDGKETVDMDIIDLQEAIKKVLDRETDIAILQSILMDLVNHMGEYKDLGHCDDCGDYIEQYTLEI